MATEIWVNIGSSNGFCLTAPSHYLNQCWLIIRDIHIRAISQEMPQPSVTKIHLKITYMYLNLIQVSQGSMSLLKFHWSLPGANESMSSRHPTEAGSLHPGGVPCQQPRIHDSLTPSDAIWRQRSGSPLAQVMACCLTAPSHYLNQCWLINVFQVPHRSLFPSPWRSPLSAAKSTWPLVWTDRGLCSIPWTDSSNGSMSR